MKALLIFPGISVFVPLLLKIDFFDFFDFDRRFVVVKSDVRSDVDFNEPRIQLLGDLTRQNSSPCVTLLHHTVTFFSGWPILGNYPIFPRVFIVVYSSNYTTVHNILYDPPSAIERLADPT